jgi:hypothetical protein
MISSNIHKIKAIKASKITQQSTGSYVRDITIRSQDGKLQLTLFADKKEDLRIQAGEWDDE